MTWFCAPSQLPLSPRPQPDEVLSSWLLRVAAANGLTLAELLGGFEAQHPGAFAAAGLLDCALPNPTLNALAQFCRVPVTTLEALDLQRRAPRLEPRMLLRYRSLAGPCWPDRLRGARRTNPASHWSRCHAVRARYAHCPACLRTQAVPHVRWEWCFAGLIHCSVHRVRLRDGCPLCGEIDPLHFTPPHQPEPPRCWSCIARLGDDGSVDHPPAPRSWEAEMAVADAYRGVLRGVPPHPKVLGKATSREFRRFVNDMLELLGRCLEQNPAYPAYGSLTRQDLVDIVGDLVRTAAPAHNVRRRRARHARALVLWGTLLKLLNPSEGADLEHHSAYWPLAIRRRLASAMLQRRRRRWPHNPFSAHEIRLGFKCSTLSAVYDLSARKGGGQASSTI